MENLEIICNYKNTKTNILIVISSYGSLNLKNKVKVFKSRFLEKSRKCNQITFRKKVAVSRPTEI